MTVSPAPKGAQTITLWLLRLVATIEIILLAAQPIFAGLFLSGKYEILTSHRTVGGILIAVGMLQAVAGVLVWRPGRLGATPMVLTIAILVLTVVQLIAGYGRVLGLHLPLGVTLIVTELVLAHMAWRRRGASA